MSRVLILAQGKLKPPALRQLCDEYYGRCRQRLQVEEREVREARRLQEAVPARRTLVVLDERGEQLSSRRFARRLDRWCQAQGSTTVFVVGGADGVPAALREGADLLLSLGPMTLAHRLARLVLAEQLYRATSILSGAPYHRE